MWPRGWVEVWLYSSMTVALERGEWSAARPGRTLPPGKTRYPFYRSPRARLDGRKISSPTGIRSRTVQPIVSRYTDWATQPTYIYIYILTVKYLHIIGADFNTLSKHSHLLCHKCNFPFTLLAVLNVYALDGRWFVANSGPFPQKVHCFEAPHKRNIRRTWRLTSHLFGAC